MALFNADVSQTQHIKAFQQLIGISIFTCLAHLLHILHILTHFGTDLLFYPCLHSENVITRSEWTGETKCFNHLAIGLKKIKLFRVTNTIQEKPDGFPSKIVT